MKKQYIKPEQHIIELQHQSHLLAGSGPELQSLRGCSFNYCGSDEDYDEEEAR